MSVAFSFSRRIGAILLLCLAVAIAARAAESNFDVPMESGADGEIRISAPRNQFPSSGFLPLRIRVVNRSSAEHSWHLDLGSGMNYGIASNEVWSSHTVTAPGNSTREFFVFMPLDLDRRTYGTVWGRAAGRQVKPGQFNLPVSLGNISYLSLNEIALEPALVESLRQVFFDYLDSSPSSPTSMPHRPKPTMESFSVMEPDDWPADWRVWSAFNTVVLAESHWKRLDEPRRQAFLNWAALGGRLLLVPETHQTEISRTRQASGEVTTLPLSKPSLAWDYLTRDDVPGRSPRWPLEGLPTQHWQANRQTGWLSAFIILFGVLVGPVNFFFFAPAGRRHRLFATVPLISLIAIGVLVIIIVAKDGFGGDGTRHVMVTLFPERNQAVVFQSQICRTGLLGRREFVLPSDVSIEKKIVDEASTGSPGEVWRDGDRAFGDWFVSRATQQHYLKRTIPSRERVEIVGHNPDGAPVVQSTVGSVLRDFIYSDQKSKLWTIEVLPPGISVTLHPLGATLGIEAIAKVIPLSWPPPSSFYALASPAESPDVIATLSSIRWHDDAVVYVGPLVQPAAPAATDSRPKL